MDEFDSMNENDNFEDELDMNTSNEEPKIEAFGDIPIKKKRGRPKTQSPDDKEKKPTSQTPYSLFKQDITEKLLEKHPNLKFIELRKLAKEAWSNLGEDEKLIWRQKAKQRKKIAKGMITTGDESPAKIKKPRKSLKNEEKVEEFVQDCKPIDIAAHFALLSDSLASIGNKLKEPQDETNNNYNVTDTLLDSLLCSLGSLLCLTSEVDALNGCPKDMLIRILDNTSLLIPDN